MHISKLVLASNNQGKIREFQDIFSTIGIEVIPQAEFNVPDIDEPFETFVENALHKARHCSNYTDLPVLADDSGLCVNSLNGRPGIYSARYAGTPKSDLNNNLKLIQDLENIDDRSAYYYCLLVILRSNADPQPIIADGILNGVIVNDARGTNGFGYDPYFYLPMFNKTAAELTTEIKNQISHRSLAINNLISKLQLFNKDIAN